MQYIIEHYIRAAHEWKNYHKIACGFAWINIEHSRLIIWQFVTLYILFLCVFLFYAMFLFFWLDVLRLHPLNTTVNIVSISLLCDVRYVCVCVYPVPIISMRLIMLAWIKGPSPWKWYHWIETPIHTRSHYEQSIQTKNIANNTKLTSEPTKSASSPVALRASMVDDGSQFSFIIQPKCAEVVVGRHRWRPKMDLFASFVAIKLDNHLENAAFFFGQTDAKCIPWRYESTDQYCFLCAQKPNSSQNQCQWHCWKRTTVAYHLPKPHAIRCCCLARDRWMCACERVCVCSSTGEVNHTPAEVNDWNFSCKIREQLNLLPLHTHIRRALIQVQTGYIHIFFCVPLCI